MNIIVYKDGENLTHLVVSLNHMCGSIVVNPRPDLKGEYVVDDIVSVDIQPYMHGWVAVAVYSLKIETGRVEISANDNIAAGFFEEQQDLIGKRLSPHGENVPIGI